MTDYKNPQTCLKSGHQSAHFSHLSMNVTSHVYVIRSEQRTEMYFTVPKLGITEKSCDQPEAQSHDPEINSLMTEQDGLQRLCTKENTDLKLSPNTVVPAAPLRFLFILTKLSVSFYKT